MSIPCVKGSSQRGAFIESSQERSECAMHRAMHRFLLSDPKYNLTSLNVRSEYPELLSGYLKVSGRNLKSFSRKQKRRPCSITLSRFRRIIEAVANAGDVEDKPRSLGNWFDFLAQECHIYMQAVRPGVYRVSPYLFEEHLPCEDLPAVDNEH